MRYLVFFIVVLSALPALGQTAPSEPASQPVDLGTRTLIIFRANCSRCHDGIRVPPRGGFGYVTDLPRIAANPKLVTPGNPETSRLYQLIAAKKMPPDPHAPLSPEQCQVVHDWILAGAPAATSPATLPSYFPAATRPRPAAATEDAHPPASEPPAFDIRPYLALIPKFHVVMVHFPIACLLIAAVAEIYAARKRIQLPHTRLLLHIGTGTALLSAALGWARAISASKDLHDWITATHATLGTAAAFLALLASFFFEERRSTNRFPYITTLLILLTALLAIAAGHFGGLLVHSSDYFTP